MFSVAQSSIVGTKVVVNAKKSSNVKSSSIVRCNAQKEERSSSLQQAAVATVLSMSMLAQPVFAASEIAQFADGSSKAAADALLADYTSKRAIVQQAPKTKSLASKKAKKEGGGFSLPSVSLPSISLPSVSLPSISLPSVGSGKQKAAPAKKAKKAPKVAKEATGTNLLGTCLVLFSPLFLVQAESFRTLARLAKEGGGFSLPSISLPSISLPSISLPSVGSGKQKGKGR